MLVSILIPRIGNAALVGFISVSSEMTHCSGPVV